MFYFLLSWNGFVIPYLFAAFFSVLSNCLCVFFVQRGLIVLEGDQIIMDVFLHNNIIQLFLFAVLFSVQKIQGKVRFRIRDTFKGKKEMIQFLLFAFPVVASIYKTYLLGFIQVTTITICSMVVPFTVWVLAIFLLHEKFRPAYAKYGLLALVGFVFVNMQKLANGSISFGYMHYLLSYILVVSFGQITARYYCKIRDHSLQAILAELLIFFIYAVVFLTLRQTFSLNLLLNPYVWCVATCCFLRNVLVISGVRKATSVVALEFCGFSKPIFACVIMFILVGELPTQMKVIGMIIIGVAIVRFHALERKYKRERKAIGQKLFDEKTIEKVQSQKENGSL